MQMHPRFFIMQEAQIEINSAIVVATQKHQLTRWEIVSILTHQLMRFSRSAIRDERHPDDPEKGGDVE